MMQMTWTLMIVSIVGSWSPDVRMHNIPMSSKEACIRAAKWAAENSSSQIGHICISSETGEVIKVNR